MSPSWTDLFLPGPKDLPCWGMHLGRRGAWTVRNPNGGAPARWQDARFHAFPSEPLREGPGKAYARALTDLLRTLDPTQGQAAFQLSLADPMVRTEVFPVERVPRGKDELEEFLSWRFQEGRSSAGPGYLFTHQDLGQEGGKRFLLVSALEKDWGAMLTQAFRSAGIFPVLVDSGASFRYGLFYDQFQAMGKAGAFLTLENEFWSLLVFDEHFRVRFVRAKWWNSGSGRVPRPPLKETAQEVERSLRSFLFSGAREGVSHPPLGSFFLCLPASWQKPLAKGLKAHFPGWRVLAPGPLPKSPSRIPLESPSALAAAVSR